MKQNTRIYKMSFASVYVLYIAKAEKKWRTKEEVDTIIYWLTGYDEKGFQKQLDNMTDFEKFFAEAPQMNPNVHLIKWVICGYRIEDMEGPPHEKNPLPRQAHRWTGKREKDGEDIERIKLALVKLKKLIELS